MSSESYHSRSPPRHSANSTSGNLQLNDTAILVPLYRKVMENHRAEQKVEDRHPQENSTASGPSNVIPDRVQYPPHEYQAFKTSRSIRILRIFDCNFATREIMANFFDEDLDPSGNVNTGYYALSYTWAAPAEGVEDTASASPWSLVICEVPDWKAGYEEEDLRITSVSIQPNLTDFLDELMHLHKQKDAYLAFEIWIDAICIDQNNPSEKLAQIALMGDIYTNAQLVYIWLGRHDRHWDTFRWVNGPLSEGLGGLNLGRPDEFHRILSGYSPMDSSFWDEYLPDLIPPERDWSTVWRSYWTFFAERKWFSRVWTFQEALLARKAYVYAGESLEHSVSFTSITELLVLLEQLGWRKTLYYHLEWSGAQTLHPGRTLLNLYNSRKEITKYISWSATSRTVNAINLQDWIELWQSLIHSTRSRSCWLERDKVYGTLGIANIIRPACIADSILTDTEDYSNEEVFTWMSSLFLEKSKDLDHLAMIGSCASTGSSELPSWVADFSKHVGWSVLCPDKKFNASLSASRETSGHVTVKGKRLVCQGIRVCYVDEARGGLSALIIPELLFGHTVLNRIFEPYGPTNQAYGEVLWRTLLLNGKFCKDDKIDGLKDDVAKWVESAFILKALFPLFRGSILTSLIEDFPDGVWEEFLASLLECNPGIPVDSSLLMEQVRTLRQHPGFEEISRRVNEPCDHLHQAFDVLRGSPELRYYAHCFLSEHIFRQLSEAVHGRTLCFCDNDYMGLCHKDCDLGDEVWILKGGRTPYVLRPREDQADLYTFQGDCYIHGLMEGEYFSGLEEPHPWIEIEIV